MEKRMKPSRASRPTALIAIAATILAACGETPISTEPLTVTPVARSNLVSGVVLPRAVVVFKDTSGVPSAGLSLITLIGGTVTPSSDAFSDVGIAFVDGLSAAAILQLRASPLVESVGFDRFLNWIPNASAVAVQATDALPSGNPWEASFYADGRQWGPRIMQADVAWRAGMLGSPSVRVGILDTGIDYDNRELAGLVDHSASRSFTSLFASEQGITVDLGQDPQVPGDHPYMDNHFHGTHVASTVAANARSVAGITQLSTLVAVKVLNVLGSGTFEGVAAGIVYAADEANVDVINMSLGALVDKNEEGVPALLTLMQRTIKKAEKEGAIVISAAGNDEINLDVGSIVSTPCEQSTICVSATGPILQQNFDQPASYTNYGITAIEVAAPGGNTDANGNDQTEDLIIGACSRRTTQPGLTPCRASTDGVAYFYAWAAGTSMATPHTAGLAALIKSVTPTLSVKGLRNRILSTADDVGAPGRDIYSNHGRINARRGVGL
jgi:subtilisin family serine protease